MISALTAVELTGTTAGSSVSGPAYKLQLHLTRITATIVMRHPIYRNIDTVYGTLKLQEAQLLLGDRATR